MAKQIWRRALLLSLILSTTLAPLAQTQGTASAGKASSGNSELLAMLERLEKQVWEKFKNKDKAGYTAIVTDDYTAVAADGKGERDLKGTLDSFKDITIGSYALSDFRLTMLGPSAALLRYNASAKYSIGTQPFSGRLAVGDIWVKRGGHWKSIRYQETEMK
jgi:hypothetical protein